MELIGSASPAADAEIIEIVSLFYERIGIGKVQVLINSIGRAECRSRYREVVLKHFAPYLRDLGEEEREKSHMNPLRLLDSKDPDAAELKASVPIILDYLEDEAKANFDSLQAYLTKSGISYRISPDIVRGLDYYTDTVFEVVSDRLGAQSSLCGGGRYDGLIQELGGPPTPSVGVGMGIERAILVLESLGIDMPASRPAVFVVQATPDAGEACRTLARDLRAQGLAVHQDFEGKKMAAQLKIADKVQARMAAIIGSDELESGTIILRNLESGEQQTVPANEIVSKVTAQL